MILTIDQQIERMAELWPGWSVKRLSGQGAEWSGTLRPNRTEYQLRVRYRVPELLLTLTVLQAQPRVYVDWPALQEKPGNPEGRIPHVYWPVSDPNGQPSLCLFDPEAREWGSGEYIADTTIPWAALWLNWYEGWLITGKWLGSGRHARRSADGRREPKRLEDEALERNAA